MDPSTETSLKKALDEKRKAVAAQVDTVRKLKSVRLTDKVAVDTAVELLKALKLEKAVAEEELVGTFKNNDFESNERFRDSLNDTLLRNYFYKPSYDIYSGDYCLYDYGPPGCALKSNVLTLWRQHFILEGEALEVETPCVTPEIVLNASSHVHKLTDFMVKDEKTGTCYHDKQLLEDFSEEKLDSKDEEKSAELKHVLDELDEFSGDKLGLKIKEYGITAPETNNPLSHPSPFGLMFKTSLIGPSALTSAYMRSETAQGIFVNFKDLYNYNGQKLPFAAAQIGQAFINEISPSQGLLGAREFTLAEIEHFYDPNDKSHPKFHEVRYIDCLILSRALQMSGQPAQKMFLKNAASKGITPAVISSETLGYFIGKVCRFLQRLDFGWDNIRFRQRLVNEMAYYEEDCWVAEIECSYGWIECVEIAARSTHDLRAHTDKSGVELVAHEVEAVDEKESLEIKAILESEGEVEFYVCPLDESVTITDEMVTIEKVKTRETFTPSVVGSSFSIGRIIYCLYELSFYTRPSEDVDDELMNVFGFSSLLAPIKCTLFDLVQKAEYEEVADRIKKTLISKGISCKLNNGGTPIEKRYAESDEIGVPFAITVDSTSSITIRERDGRQQIRVDIDKAVDVITRLVYNSITWDEFLLTHPTHSSSFNDEN